MTEPEDTTPDGGAEDFASLFEQSGAMRALALDVGARVRAKIVHIGKEDVFCEVSPTQEGVVPKSELVDAEGKLNVEIGDVLDLFVVSQEHGIQLSRRLGRDAANIETLMQAAHTQLPVDGQVTGVNKGGLEVAVGSVRAFCPIGQADIGFVENPQTFVGKTLQFVVKEVRENGRNVVLSRRALLEVERAEKAKQLLSTLEVGQQLTGTVTRLADFGAFVDVGGLEGLLPISEISHARIASPRDILKEGESVTVALLRVEADPRRPERPRLTLSLKATLPDPFTEHAAKLAEGATFEGKVSRLEKYGAFVELFPGLDGLVHVSELSTKRVRHPSDVVQVGQNVTVRIIGVSTDDKRISLSLREAEPKAKPGEAPAVGTLVEGTVDRIERYGVFVKLAGGASALLPAAESGTPPGSDLTKAFAIGSTHALVVSAIDERGRLKVSKRAREAAEERAVLEDYQRGQAGGQGLGTLGDLLRAKTKK